MEDRRLRQQVVGAQGIEALDRVTAGRAAPQSFDAADFGENLLDEIFLDGVLEPDCPRKGRGSPVGA